MQQDDVLADKRGIDLVEGAEQADSAVLADAALEAEAKERVEIGFRCDQADVGGGAGPALERGLAVEAAMRAEMVLTLASRRPRRALSASRLRVSSALRLGSSCALQVRKNLSIFPFP